MIPLVDICLVLLIDFIVLSPRMIPELSVQMAATKRRSWGCGDGQLYVRLSGQGRVQLNGMRLDSDEEFRDRLEAMLLNRDSKNVFLLFSDDVAYGRAVAVLDISKRAGAERLLISRKRYANSKLVS